MVVLKPHMKLNKIQFCEVPQRKERRDYLKFSSSAFSAVNYCVSFMIKPAVVLAGGWADT
jgi:hypothetical protein